MPVDRSNGWQAREATPDEIATGEYCANTDEWAQTNEHANLETF